MRLIALIFFLLSCQAYAQVSAYPAAVVSSYQAGIEAYKQNNLPEAKAHFIDCIRAEMSCFEGYLGLSQVFFLEKNYPEALASAEKGALFQPFDPELTGVIGKSYYYLEDYKSAETYLKRALSIGNESVENTTCLALSLQKLGNYKEAIYYFDLALNIAPENYGIWFDRGRLYTEMELYEKGIDDFEHALKLSPENALICAHIAQNYYALDQDAKALEYTELGLKNGNSNDKVNLLLIKGNLYQKQGDLDQANALYAEAFDMESTNALVLVNQAAVLIEMENFADAIEKCNDAIGFEPNLMEAYFNRGIANEMLRDVEGACSDWQKAFVLGSGRAIEYLNGPVCNE